MDQRTAAVLTAVAGVEALGRVAAGTVALPSFAGLRMRLADELICEQAEGLASRSLWGWARRRVRELGASWSGGVSFTGW
jgi:hypothetical protein